MGGFELRPESRGAQANCPAQDAQKAAGVLHSAAEAEPPWQKASWAALATCRRLARQLRRVRLCSAANSHVWSGGQAGELVSEAGSDDLATPERSAKGNHAT